MSEKYLAIVKTDDGYDVAELQNDIISNRRMFSEVFFSDPHDKTINDHILENTGVMTITGYGILEGDKVTMTSMIEDMPGSILEQFQSHSPKP